MNTKYDWIINATDLEMKSIVQILVDNNISNFEFRKVKQNITKNTKKILIRAGSFKIVEK